ncbi:MAG TPA: hypothetical protein VLM38_16405 [Blastocatellia bacterium]|nr:hypothetical protein [Blastocatellia bacterium]
MYCGEALPFSRINAAPPQRNIDAGERVFNTVLEPLSASPKETVVAQLASALQIELSDAKAVTESQKPIPLARTQTRSEAEMIAALIRTCGLRAVVIADEELSLDRELIRARRISLTGDQVEIHHAGGDVSLPTSEIKLLVIGGLQNTRVDYTERISGSRGRSGNVMDTSEYRSEETLLDCYATSLDKSFRIKSDAFDYSGLVSPMSFRTDVNFRAALDSLRTMLPHAAIDDDFSRTRRLLERAWPARSRNEPRGIKRTGLAFRAVAQATLVSNNRDQFERYSRLMSLYSALARR